MPENSKVFRYLWSPSFVSFIQVVLVHVFTPQFDMTHRPLNCGQIMYRLNKINIYVKKKSKSSLSLLPAPRPRLLNYYQYIKKKLTSHLTWCRAWVFSERGSACHNALDPNDTDFVLETSCLHGTGSNVSSFHLS